MEKFIGSIKQLVSSIKRWVKENPREFWILLGILLVGSFLRLYKIDQYMTFLGDEGRDAIIVRRLLVYGDPILVGPGTSIGNMYLGPLYYYLMAPALFLANFSPAGPAVQIAILGIITIGMVYFIALEWFGKEAAKIASALYAVAPTVIVYSRSSWNPNIMPFFALLSVYSIWNVWKKNKFGWLIVLGVAYAFMLQSHYLGLLLAPTLLLFWILTLRNLKLFRNSKFEIRNFLQKSILGLLIFAGLMSPLVIFDVRHGFINLNAMKKFFSERQTTVSARPWTGIPKAFPQFEKINTRLLSGRSEPIGKIVSISIVAVLFYVAYSNKRKGKSIIPDSLFMVLVWLGFALIGLGLYKQEIYDHYYGFFFAAPFFLVGGLSEYLINNPFRDQSTKYKALKAAVLFAICFLLLINLANHPFRNPPQMQMQRAQTVAAKITEESQKAPFNLAVIAERNYEDGYQYFLELHGLPVVDIDAQRPETVEAQLFVVCEMPKEKCDPTHSSKAEVANFGWSKIESEWEVFGTRVYKLVHTQ